ncbi:uncharacterized protein A1O9_07196 [Exophiala aquamarina CBS 119918]|uniref:Uncharacterized protein n=1 Tax=Exophiala aquamarina CBS 119918 TaxID=1182545 RepID=A0A072PAV4_9EURO|nr:uncharacterized protein A1O9_07196 [Exophiala aquamarina CBS 119918]KEF57006.1 hypothetical protein A1O9_07196 [Exophiala aquamarina CBS 119918]
MPIISTVIKGVGAGIGMAHEAVADHKEKKAAQNRGVSPHPPGGSTEEQMKSLGKQRSNEDRELDSSSSDDSDLETDRAEWALDKAAQELEEHLPSYDESAAATSPSPEEIANSFVQTLQLSKLPPQTYTPLPNPVILPQRRPKDKSRGFVRAYAPLLGSCAGIDQKMFIDFLNDFDRASRASPVFDVINVACFAVGVIPNPIAMAVTTAVQVASRTAQEVQSRYRRNTYLDQINESLFKPRGLYCLIMTFKPDNPHKPVLNLDVRSQESSDQGLLKATSTPESEIRGKLKQIRLTSGTTKGELSLPESAPLIYPAVDAAARAALEAEGGAGAAPQEKEQNAFKSAGAFMATYLDRRAQASYTGSHPMSKLATPPPEKKFASRYSDPNHPANSGTILGLLTGGKFDPKARRRGERAQRRAHRRGYHLSETDVKNAEMGRLPRRKKGLMGRVLHKDVLYLTIVNLPSESEMKELAQEWERLNS